MVQQTIDALLVLVVLGNLAMLGTSKMRSLIRLVGFQGLLLGAFSYLAHLPHFSLRALIFSLFVLGLKGLAFPWLLMRTLRQLKVVRDVEPLISLRLTLLLGMVGLGLCYWLAFSLPLLAQEGRGELAVAVAFMTTLCGLLLLISRRKALSQVVGFLVTENGIFLFGTVMSPQSPVLIELSVLLDLFVAVFVMGIALHHISREFQSVDTNLITSLKD